MNNFSYSLKTNIVFGRGQIKQLESLLKEASVKRMLLVYGKASIKNLGIYDDILDVTKKLNIPLFEESGVAANPDLESVLSGQKTVQKENIDFILAAGGGSVLDCAKAIAYSYKLEASDVWDVLLNKKSFEEALPVGTILTLAATGSETNGNIVISNRKLKDKRSIASPKLVPKFSIIDPAYTLSVPKHHTIAGSIDIMMHIFEQYFSLELDTSTSDYLSLGLLESVMENTDAILSGKDGYLVRANISWAATIALSWLLQQGKSGDWASHRLSYPFTADYGTTHGFALAILQPAWMKVALKYKPELMEPRLKALGKRIYNEMDPLKVIERIKETLSSFGAATSFKEANLEIDKEAMISMAKRTVALGPVGKIIPVDEEKALEIYQAAKG